MAEERNNGGGGRTAATAGIIALLLLLGGGGYFGYVLILATSILAITLRDIGDSGTFAFPLNARSPR